MDSVRNEIVGATIHGNVLQGGTVQLAAGKPPRSGYVHQVRRLRAVQLVGREQELAEISAFCTAPNGPDYLCWQAPAWAGKTALLAEFVLEPPTGVRVVAFFVTARLAGQNDRAAFCEVVERQLYEILGEQAPAVSEHTRDEQLLDALERAALRCSDHRERLVLVVDGLDEDRGVTAGPDSYSIAALLPSRPVGGMRVVVAGRPAPPMPDDVPPGHPLRRRDNIRPLAPSPSASTVRGDMERELLRLVASSGVERDLLGLVAGSGGGLSADDLGQLTGCSTWIVRRHLASVTGRTFRTSQAHWSAEGPEVYLLGHEDLHRHALQVLGPDLSGYRDRLHAWAEDRERALWPQDTSEYLLRGYPRLLEETGDTSRLLRLALDRNRQERLLLTSGDDLETIREVVRAKELIVSADPVDVEAMLRLSVELEALETRNEALPEELLELWARLGQLGRAVNLARSIPGRFEQIVALGTVLRRTAQDSADRVRLVESVTELVLSMACAITNPGERGSAMASACGALAAAGDHARAHELAAALPEEWQREWARAEIADALARTGHWQQAVELATDLATAAERVPTLVGIALVAADTGQGDLAQDLAERIVDQLPLLLDARLPPEALAAIAPDLARLGRLQPALSLIHHRQEVPDDQVPPHQDELSDTVRVLACGGDFEQALALAEERLDGGHRTQALADIAVALALAGKTRQARRLAERVSDPQQQASAMADIAYAMARADRVDKALELADTLFGAPEEQVRALTRIAHVLVDTGQTDLASSLAQRSTDLARSTCDHQEHARNLATVAGALAASGSHTQARELAHRAASLLPGPGAGQKRSVRSVHVLEGLAVTLVQAGDRDGAIALARRACAILTTVSDPDEREGPIMRLAPFLSEEGLDDEALDLASTLTDLGTLIITLAGVTTVIADQGRTQTARALADDLVDWLAELDDDDARLTAEVALCLHRCGRAEQAAELTRQLSQPFKRARCLAELAGLLHSVGDTEQAHRYAHQCLALLGPHPDLERHEQLATDLVSVLSTSDLDAATNLAKGLRGPIARVRVLTAVASALPPAQHGAEIRNLLRQALAIARDTDNRTGENAAPLARIARLQARAGDLQGAQETARQLQGIHRASALAGIARTLGPSSQGRQLCAEAIHLVGWRTTVASLDTVAPGALATLTQALYSTMPTPEHDPDAATGTQA
ncbi:tetratricopeptide repeat protein [Streptomyces sp. CBMA123]|uniref:tetratricopeptide repeat protein n=1 Tax=Streptomyces sp. CBMA123 TaxID=1896313 RepID=UPI001661E534|nr:tetratricopeptide repeat protein [Streptomyces sp. CBMA123]MBD0694926.1 hypothetical protein [Streptomyces sp. CBMA123]